MDADPDPFESFYKLTPEFLLRMREQHPTRAPEIDELRELVPFVRRMADESNERTLTNDERARLLYAAQRMAVLSELLMQPDPTKQ